MMFIVSILAAIGFCVVLAAIFIIAYIFIDDYWWRGYHEGYTKGQRDIIGQYENVKGRTDND